MNCCVIDLSHTFIAIQKYLLLVQDQARQLWECNVHHLPTNISLEEKDFQRLSGIQFQESQFHCEKHLVRRLIVRLP